MKIILQIIVIVLILAGFVWVLGIGMEREAKVYCNNLISQSETYKNAGFFITRSEANMCTDLGIFINAPIQVECVNGVSIDVPRCEIEE